MGGLLDFCFPPQLMWTALVCWEDPGIHTAGGGGSPSSSSREKGLLGGRGQGALAGGAWLSAVLAVLGSFKEEEKSLGVSHLEKKYRVLSDMDHSPN